MKKMFLGIFAVLLAVATVFATNAHENATRGTTVYHWFDGQIFVGDGTVEDMSPLCSQLDNIECLAGFNPNVGQTRPSTEPEQVLTKD